LATSMTGSSSVMTPRSGEGDLGGAAPGDQIEMCDQKCDICVRADLPCCHAQPHSSISRKSHHDAEVRAYHLDFTLFVNSCQPLHLFARLTCRCLSHHQWLLWWDCWLSRQG
jgi:hypothetical protein